MGHCSNCAGYKNNHRTGSRYAHEKFNPFYGGIDKLSGYLESTSKTKSPGQDEFFKWKGLMG